MYKCTIQTEAHAWRVSTLLHDQVKSITRGSPVSTEDNHELRLIEDKGDVIVTSLTIMVISAMHDGATILCFDSINPKNGENRKQQ